MLSILFCRVLLQLVRLKEHGQGLRGPPAWLCRPSPGREVTTLSPLLAQEPHLHAAAAVLPRLGWVRRDEMGLRVFGALLADPPHAAEATFIRGKQ